MKELIPIILYFLILIGYVVISIFRSSSAVKVLSLISLLISLFMAIIFNNLIAAFLSNNIELVKIRNDVNIYLGIEIIYYKLIAFVCVFVLLEVIFTVVINYTSIANKIKIKDNKILTGVLAMIIGFIWVTMLMNIFMSSAYYVEYETKFVDTLANLPIIGSIFDTVMYDFQNIVEISQEYPNFGIDALNVEILRKLESDGYVSKGAMKMILNNYENYGSIVKNWLDS